MAWSVSAAWQAFTERGSISVVSLEQKPESLEQTADAGASVRSHNANTEIKSLALVLQSLAAIRCGAVSAPSLRQATREPLRPQR